METIKRKQNKVVLWSDSPVLTLLTLSLGHQGWDAVVGGLLLSSTVILVLWFCNRYFEQWSKLEIPVSVLADRHQTLLPRCVPQLRGSPGQRAPTSVSECWWVKPHAKSSLLLFCLHFQLPTVFLIACPSQGTVKSTYTAPQSWSFSPVIKQSFVPALQSTPNETPHSATAAQHRTL